MTLVGIHFSGGSSETPVATVTLDRDGELVRVDAEGDGMVNAAFVAVQDAYDMAATSGRLSRIPAHIRR